MKGLSSLSCEKPPYFNFGVYNLLEVTDYGHFFVLKNPVRAHCNISQTNHQPSEYEAASRELPL